MIAGRLSALDAQHGEVGLGIVLPDHLGEQLLAIGERDFDLVGGLDHVMVGEHVAAGAHDADRGWRRAARRRRRAADAEEAPERWIVEQRMAR